MNTSVASKLSAVELATQSLTTNPIAQRSAAEQLFHSVFNDPKIRTVQMKDDWANGTGYFDGVCRDTQLCDEMKLGEVVKFVGNSARPALIVKTFAGCLVFFQRYTNQGPITFNAPRFLFESCNNDVEYDENTMLPIGTSGVARQYVLNEALIRRSLSHAEDVSTMKHIEKMTIGNQQLQKAIDNF